MDRDPIKLKIELKSMPHKVLRRVLVPEDINMYQFHLVIQKAIGWENRHLFEFTERKKGPEIRAGVPNEDSAESKLGFTWGGTIEDAHQMYLKEDFLIGNSRKPFWYTYDFSNDWSHQVSFLKPGKDDREEFEGQPLCVEACGKCPPEDVGGSYAYASFLEIIHGDKNDPEVQELIDWMEINPDNYKNYDENEVNLAQINQQLSQLPMEKSWYAVEYDTK